MGERTIAPDVALAAGAIGEPARAAMLMALLGGEALSAGELARRAGIAPGTATAHLARLLEAGLVSRRVAGRRRMFELADDHVAAALEALARISPASVQRSDSGSRDALRFARTCYDHLGGALAMAVVDAMVARGLLERRTYELRKDGASWLSTLDIDAAELGRQRRHLTRPCLDWSERRDHLAGAVGAALLSTMLERRWIVRQEGTRAVRLTLRGREGLHRALGLDAASTLPAGSGP
jgi:DNA-binding transcriptional ArsR family regulator